MRESFGLCVFESPSPHMQAMDALARAVRAVRAVQVVQVVQALPRCISAALDATPVVKRFAPPPHANDLDVV